MEPEEIDFNEFIYQKEINIGFLIMIKILMK